MIPSHLLGKKFEPDRSGACMAGDLMYGNPFWPLQVIDGPYYCEFDEVDKYVVRFKDGKVDLIDETRFKTWLKEVMSDRV